MEHTHKIIYVGMSYDGSLSFKRYQLLKSIYPDTKIIAIDRFVTEYSRSIYSIVDLRLRIPIMATLLNIYLVYILLVKKSQADIIWFDKPVWLYSWVLSKLSKYKTICFSADDYLNEREFTPCFMKNLSKFNLVITTKRYNVSELVALGVYNIYHVLPHFEGECTNRLGVENVKNEMIFVGHYEKDRYIYLKDLALNHKNLRIYGASWPDIANALVSSPVFGARYPELLSVHKVSIAFLRRESRDEITTRSFELPIFGNIVVMETSELHQQLFKGLPGIFLFSNQKEFTQQIEMAMSTHLSLQQRIQRSKSLEVYSFKNHIPNIIKLLDA